MRKDKIMFAIIMTDKDDSGLILYGPFTSFAAAHHYAQRHGIEGYLVSRLHDSGDAMDEE